MLVKKKFKTKKYLCEKAVRQKVDSTLCVSYKFLISFLKSFGGQQGRGQNEVVGSQLGSEYDRSRRNRSLDRSTELEQFNSTFRGSSRGLAGEWSVPPAWGVAASRRDQSSPPTIASADRATNHGARRTIRSWLNSSNNTLRRRYITPEAIRMAPEIV